MDELLKQIAWVEGVLADARQLQSEQDPDVPSNWPETIAKLEGQLLELQVALEKVSVEAI